MSLIITTVLTSIGLAFLLGFLLGLFKKIFSVEVKQTAADAVMQDAMRSRRLLQAERLLPEAVLPAVRMFRINLENFWE